MQGFFRLDVSVCVAMFTCLCMSMGVDVGGADMRGRHIAWVKEAAYKERLYFY